ncbi:MAG: hypothetical protein PSX37_01085 [bacterium]|nr:hypothetical protein [bacterium]
MLNAKSKTCVMVRPVCVLAAMIALCGLATGGSAAGAGAGVTSFERAAADDLKAMFTPVLPAGAKEISAAMTAAKVGETITIRGNVAMSKDAFSAKQAVFTLVDERLRTGAAPAARALPETAADIPPEGRVTIQVVGADGKPLRKELNGERGLKPGAEVFVTGKVESANGKDALVLTATAFHVPRSALPTAFFVDKAPETARDVSEARKAGTMKEGDEVVLRGRVGGSKDPFVEGRAVFTLMGRALKACNENPDDKCSVPWDYCCETKADIAANSVTVQVVDGKGQPLRTDMKGRRDLKELSEMVVIGKVTSVKGGAVVVSATGAQVTKVE